MDKGQEVRRSTRLLELCWRIAAEPRQWSRKRLAEHYAVSERQITKDLEYLRADLRLPVRRSGDGYYLEHSPRLAGITFTFAETLAILLATQAGAPGARIEGEAFETALGRIDSLFPREFRPVLHSARAEADGHDGHGSLLATLQAAIVACRQVHVRYHHGVPDGATSEQIVDPYALVPAAGTWHLAGHCHRCGDARFFAVDRIRQLRLRDQHFTPPAHFDLGALLRSASECAEDRLIAGADWRPEAPQSPPWGGDGEDRAIAQQPVRTDDSAD